MNNRKPTFSRVGMVDDPHAKSKGGPFILLLNRTFEAEEAAMFNFDPDVQFYPRRPVWQLDLNELLLRESRRYFFCK